MPWLIRFLKFFRIIQIIFSADAYEAGALIVATGRSDFPNQVNNSLVFPGLFRALIDTRAKYVKLIE